MTRAERGALWALLAVLVVAWAYAATMAAIAIAHGGLAA